MVAVPRIGSGRCAVAFRFSNNRTGPIRESRFRAIISSLNINHLAIRSSSLSYKVALPVRYSKSCSILHQTAYDTDRSHLDPARQHLTPNHTHGPLRQQTASSQCASHSSSRPQYDKHLSHFDSTRPDCIHGRTYFDTARPPPQSASGSCPIAHHSEASGCDQAKFPLTGSMVTQIHDAPTAAEWWETAQRANLSVPGPMAPSGRKRESVPYRLTLRVVQGLLVPEHAAQELHAKLFHRVSIALFDTEERRFFGRIWDGPETPLPSDSLHSPVDIDNDVEVYFHSTLNGGRCVMVIEQCVIVRRSSKAAEFSAGWAFLSVFDERATGRLKDVGDGPHSGGSQRSGGSSRLDFYQGSPLALLQSELRPPYGIRSGPLRRSSGQLVYTLRTDRNMSAAAHLLPEDVMTTCDTPLLGMLPIRDAAPARFSEQARWRCDADELSPLRGPPPPDPP